MAEKKIPETENPDMAEKSEESRSTLEKLAQWFPYLPHIAICGVVVVLCFAIGLIIYPQIKDGNLSDIGSASSDLARGLITFLVALVTVAIAIILTISVLLSTSPDYEDRFSKGKEILTIFIGVLGTIVGFYFGSADRSAKAPDKAQAAAASAAALSEVIPQKLTAKELEQKGFQAILAKDFNTASEAFSKAYKTWETYHNVDEINHLLSSKKEIFEKGDDNQKASTWEDIHCEIASKYQWGMSEELKLQFRDSAKKENYACGKKDEQALSGIYKWPWE